ncbi:MAG: glycosyltransferase [Lachnospiraceae bacterium]|nr:glycosyltransferase [Lachnospiraceae bacterium]
MNIAIINVVGVEGSTGKLATNLAKRFILQGHNCKVFHGRGKKSRDGVHVKQGCFFDNAVHYLVARRTGKEGYYSTYFTKRIIKKVSVFKPDRIIILNLHGHWMNIPLFLNEVAKMNVTIDWFMCDEFPYTARCEYTNGCDGYKNCCRDCPRYKNAGIQYREKEEYYRKLVDKTNFSSVQYIVERAKGSSLLRNARFAYKNTGIDTEFYHPTEDKFREKHNIAKNKIILLDVAPFSNPRKGVKMFLDAARMLASDEKYLFINVGYDGKTAVELPNFMTIPYVSDQEELREIYSAADMYICTSVEDALPNACVEAMSCGTPITAFNISGMPYLAEYPVLTLLDSVSAESIVAAVRNSKRKNREIIELCRSEAIEKYEFTKFSDSFL